MSRSYEEITVSHVMFVSVTKVMLEVFSSGYALEESCAREEMLMSGMFVWSAWAYIVVADSWQFMFINE